MNIKDMEELCYNCYSRKSYLKCGCKEECDNHGVHIR